AGEFSRVAIPDVPGQRVPTRAEGLMDLASTCFGQRRRTPRQTFREPRNAFPVERADLVLVEDLFKIEAVVPANFRIAVAAIIATEDGVVRINDVVERVSGREAFFGKDDQRSQLGGTTSEA